MQPILTQIRKDLQANIDPERKNSPQKFFKEKVKAYRVKTHTVHQIAKEHYKLIKNKPKSEIFKLCEKLQKSGYIEEAFIAYDWSYAQHKNYKPKDFKIFENWVQKYVSNWAECDTLCNHTIGTFIEMYPQYLNELKTWTKSKNRWVKRAAAVTLIIPAKKGMFLKDIFEIADALLIDKDDMVQKGYGWMLKEASKAHEKQVFEYIMKHKNKMPRTALRYAIEKMREKLRKEAMKR